MSPRGSARGPRVTTGEESEASVASRPSGLLIGGEWLEEGELAPVLDKYAGTPVAEVRHASPAHVERAVAAAAAHAAGHPLDPRGRSDVLCAAAQRLMDRKDEVVADYVAETGFTQTDAETELARTVETLTLCAGEALRLTGEVVPLAAAPGSETRLCFTVRVPVGVVGAIAPFNAPLNTVAHKIGPALAAGNPVVLKPALMTPLSSIHLCAALLDAGLPGPYLSLVVGPGSRTGQSLVEDRRVRYFTFTGSTQVGLQIKQRSGIAKTHLELGGNCATIVCEDADLSLAAELLVRGGYRKAGQVCTSVQRVLVVEDVADELEGLVAERVRALAVGDPHLPGTQVGPMISEPERVRAARMVRQAVGVGARLVTGGDGDGPLLAPTLLADVPDDAELMSDEIFAPVIAMRRVADLADGVKLANSTRYGLQAGVFTQDLDRALWAAVHLDVGGVMVNDTSSYHADLMPYGGRRDSGYGLEGPRYAVMDMTDPRTIVINRREPPGAEDRPGGG